MPSSLSLLHPEPSKGVRCSLWLYTATPQLHKQPQLHDRQATAQQIVNGQAHLAHSQLPAGPGAGLIRTRIFVFAFFSAAGSQHSMARSQPMPARRV